MEAKGSVNSMNDSPNLTVEPKKPDTSKDTLYDLIYVKVSKNAN